MPVTIRDVADRAGTSVAAVSAVISENPRHTIRIGRGTRERILAAAAELGYRPNPLARGLASGKTGVLGLVFPYSRAFTDGNPFATCVMSGVFEEVVRARYNVMLHTAIGEDWGSADDGALLDPRVDGLILVIPSPDSRVVTRCHDTGFPYVALVYDPDNPEVVTVNADEEAGGRLATEHLLSAGHKRIAHLIGDAAVATSRPRMCGYLDALLSVGLPVESELLVQSGFTHGDGYAATKRLLDLPSSQRPTAIFAANDLCAAGALEALQQRGMNVPKDMAVVGYDDTWFATRTSPPLTSVHMPIYEMGIQATQMLIARVEGRATEPRQVVLPVSLTIRASSTSPERHTDHGHRVGPKEATNVAT